MHTNELSDRGIQSEIAAAKAGKPGKQALDKGKPFDPKALVKLVDGGGLRLEINGEYCRWVFAFTWAGKQLEQPFGSYPALSLADARNLRGILREAKASGIDPHVKYIEHTGKTKAPTAPKTTLRTEMHDHIAHRQGEIKDSSNKAMVQLMERDAKTLLDMDPAKITRGDVLTVIKPLWETKRRSAEKVIAYGRMIWRFSQAASGKPNPFGEKPRDLFGKGMLRPGGDPGVTPHAAMPWQELPAFMVKLRARPEMEARAVELLLYTLTPRTAEVLNAKWEQFDFIKALWNIPQVKVGWNGRTIPLGDEAMNLLLGLKPINALPGDWVFHAERNCESGRKGDDCMQELLRLFMDLPYTVHGFRSTLMDWTAERQPMLLMAAEKALDHKIGGKVLQAYLRTGMVDNRAELSRLWAGQLTAAA